MFELSVNTNISLFGFYKYIKEISMNILTKISIESKWLKIHINTYETLKDNNKIRKNTHIKVIL